MNKELEDLLIEKEAKPSEALECLENLCDEFPILKKDYKIIKQALIKAQEQEAVLKIIFEKKIDVNNFQTSLMVMSNFTYRYYINNSRDYHTCIMVELLTEEEFELLKRWSEK